MIASVRGRLTGWYAGGLALTLGTVAGGGYGYVAHAWRSRVDESLRSSLADVGERLAAERAEGEDPGQAAHSVVTESIPSRQALVILDAKGQLLAQHALPGGTELPIQDAPRGGPRVAFSTTAASPRVRIASREFLLAGDGRYSFAVGESLEQIEGELTTVRRGIVVMIPLAVALCAFVGWVLAGRSLRPVAAAFEQRRRFMADASHELRTPVSVVRTAAAMALQRPHRDEREYREALAVIGEQASRLTRLVNDLFLLARADADQYPLVARPLHLDEVLAEAGRAAGVLATGRRVHVVNGPFPAAPCQGDEDLLRRMVLNLLENAIAHTPEGGRVALTLSRLEGAYVIRVEDDGTGIPPEEQPRVFERFHRVPGAAAPSAAMGGGAGLGLAISRWIAEAHAGTLELTRSDGQGSVFTARLPCPPAREVADPAQELSRPA